MNFVFIPPAARTLNFAPTAASRIEYVTGTPAPVICEDITACFSVAFTPSGTTVTVYHAAGGMVFTGAAARINAAYGAAMASIRHLRAWARRKPGTTGAITAQKVILQGWNGSAYEELARLNVAAATSGEPASDIVEITKIAGDARFYFGSAHPFKFLPDSVDTDLEIVCEAEGLAA